MQYITSVQIGLLQMVRVSQLRQQHPAMYTVYVCKYFFLESAMCDV